MQWLRYLVYNDGWIIIMHFQMNEYFLLWLGISNIHAFPESEPKCTTNVTENKAMAGDYVEYSCEVKYSGKRAPVVACRYNGDVLKMNLAGTEQSIHTLLSWRHHIFTSSLVKLPFTIQSQAQWEAKQQPTMFLLTAHRHTSLFTVSLGYTSCILHYLLTVSVNYSHLLTIVLCNCSTMSIYNVIQRAKHA